ncbi:MAG: ATP-binding cassette domain-containing protein [Desulfobacteraceae bacterium]|nr:ATP-binding cassette domain-containing protein [Desulfobacteraceae bacterium]
MERIDYRRAVLNVTRVTLFTEGESGEYTNAHFSLYSGQLALVHLQNMRQSASLADAFSGLLRPAKGSVLFLGRDWQHASADTANAMRGKIGRVFSSSNWLDGLSLADNILLSQRHHTRRPKDELLQEAAHLAKEFNLPGLPTGYPNEYTPHDRRRAACVRAFLGRSSLLLLEEPTLGVYPRIMASLVNAVRRVRNRGGAVFWMTLSEEIWRDDSIPADRLFRLSGRELLEVSEKHE